MSEKVWFVIGVQPHVEVSLMGVYRSIYMAERAVEVFERLYGGKWVFSISESEL